MCILDPLSLHFLPLYELFMLREDLWVKNSYFHLQNFYLADSLWRVMCMLTILKHFCWWLSIYLSIYHSISISYIFYQIISQLPTILNEEKKFAQTGQTGFDNPKGQQGNRWDRYQPPHMDRVRWEDKEAQGRGSRDWGWYYWAPAWRNLHSWVTHLPWLYLPD